MDKHVVVAEDMDFLRDTIASALQEQGVEVRAATNGQEAIEFIDAQQPDLLLLDLLMPHVDGYQVLEHVHTKGYTFPIVVLTNMSDSVNQERCIQLGAQEFWVKSDMDEEMLWEKSKVFLGME